MWVGEQQRMERDDQIDRQRLGKELYRVRDEHRINSQRKLAELSGVSESTISLIEAGKTATKPSTLMLLARGLAKDFDGQVNPERAEAIYARLMDAWGVLPKRPAPTEPRTSKAAFLAEMEQKHGRRFALAMSRVAWDDDDLPTEHRRVIEATILGLAGAAQEDGERED